MLNGIPPVAPHATHYYDSWRTTKGLTIGSSDRGSHLRRAKERESMIGIKCLRLTLVKPRVDQPRR